MAKHKKRKLIAEADIAQAFNTLMREIGAPNSFVADIDTVHRNRVAFESSLPEMLSQKSNGSYCNPGEAVFVVSMLIENVGRPAEPSSQLDLKAHVSAGVSPVRQHLELFYARHSQSEVKEAFNQLFNVFHI
jgi:hypothetical protein